MKKYMSILIIASLMPILASCGGNASLSGAIREALSLKLIEGVKINAGGQTATTNAEGMFTISGLSAGKVDVEITMEGYRSITFPEFVINEGDKNFIEATLDVATSKENLPSKEFGKPQPNPPPLPGTPVADRPKLKVIQDFNGFMVKLSEGDKNSKKNYQTFYVANGVTKLAPLGDTKMEMGTTIFTKAGIYNHTGKEWMGVKNPPDQPTPDPLADIKIMIKTVLDCYNSKASQFNLLGVKKYNGIECNNYRIVGFTDQNYNKVDGEILCPKDGQYKDTMLTFEGILEVNGSGDKIKIELYPNAVKSIDIPKNVKLMGPGEMPPGGGGR